MSGQELRKAAETLRERANAVRRPFAQQERVDIALADLLEATTCGLHCDADGKREPYCSACEDSGYDHDCPPRRECDHTVGFRHALTVARLINDGAR